MAVVGVNHVLDLTRDMFFNKTSAGPGDSVHYIASKIQRADLPSWLHLAQQNYLQPGYLYGTPNSPEDSVNLQLTAINRNTRQVSQRTMQINVNQQSDEPRFFIDLTVLNHNLGDKPVKALLNDMLVRVRRVWMNSGHIYVTKVLTLREIGQRSPVPETPGEVNLKEGLKAAPVTRPLLLPDGILIQIGGTKEFSPALKSVEVEIKRKCLGDSRIPTVSLDSGFRPDFIIDWCKYKLTYPPESTVEEVAAARPVVLQGREWDPALGALPRRDYFTDFMLTVLLPVLVTIILAILLSVMFFGGREGVERRDEITPETQLSQFNTIRRATTNLRLLSHHRDGPPQLSASPSTRDREPSTLPRSQPPPPYRLPPSYPTSNRPVIVNTEQGSNPRNFDDDSNENQRLVGQNSPRHGGNDNLGQQ